MIYTVVDVATGRVEFDGEATGLTEEQFGSCVPDGQRVIFGVRHPSGWVDADGQHHTTGDAPSASHRFDWESKAWIDPRTQEQLQADALARARARRDALLAACDWTQLADVALTEVQRTQWRDYRAALRDLPLMPGFPSVSWPVEPGA